MPRRHGKMQPMRRTHSHIVPDKTTRFQHVAVEHREDDPPFNHWSNSNSNLRRSLSSNCRIRVLTARADENSVSAQLLRTTESIPIIQADARSVCLSS